MELEILQDFFLSHIWIIFWTFFFCNFMRKTFQFYIVNGAWSSWGPWSSCDANEESMKRTRRCNNPSPKNGGASCSGSSIDTIDCRGR